MQLNIYLPKAKAAVLHRLDEAARRTGKAKNELVIEAIEAYLAESPPVFGTYNLGGSPFPSRAELYEDVLDHRVPRS